MNGLSNVLCKFRLEITKIELKVRFPCSVVCAFKNGTIWLIKTQGRYRSKVRLI